MKKEDGAYYAIKGFVYQFDKTILEILNQTDEEASVKIEQEQDLEYENYVVQVKYYETKYKPAQQKQKIKDATLKLITDFASDETKNYCLYIYFNGELPKTTKYSSVNELDKLLGNKSQMFHESFKEKFIKNFIIIYAEDYQKQFKNVISKIQTEFNCKEEAYIYHAIIRNHLFHLITEKPISNYTERQCNKNEVIENIKETKIKIFNSAYSEYLGETKYFNFIKKQFHKVDFTYNNYLFIGGNITETNSHSFAQLIKYLAEKYFDKKNSSKAKPFNVIIDKSESELIEIKKQLIRFNVKFNDGYEGYGEFSEQIFNEPSLSASSKPKRSSYSVRLISFASFKTIKNTITPDMLYIFGDNFKIKDMFKNQTNYFLVDKLDLNKIFELL